jgi:hypothetical protein
MINITLRLFIPDRRLYTTHMVGRETDTRADLNVLSRENPGIYRESRLDFSVRNQSLLTDSRLDFPSVNGIQPIFFTP